MASARGLVLAGALALSAAKACAAEFEPRLTFAAEPGVRSVALTFDACAGGFDRRILDALVQARAKATIFVTARWMRENPGAMATLLGNRRLFEIENHGEMHVPAVTDAPYVFGIRTAGSPAGVRAEVDGGGRAIEAATGRHPTWYRGATARYSRDALTIIGEMRYRIAGYSVNADKGASLPAVEAERRMAGAAAGDVVIAHINQPRRPAGAGVASGVGALAASGARFVWLSEVDAKEENLRPVVRDVEDMAGAPPPSAPAPKIIDDRPEQRPAPAPVPAAVPPLPPDALKEATKAPRPHPTRRDPNRTDPNGTEPSLTKPKLPRCSSAPWGTWLFRSCAP